MVLRGSKKPLGDQVLIDGLPLIASIPWTGKKLFNLEKSGSYRAADAGLILTVGVGKRRHALPVATARKYRGE
jgi:hypothetical protein